MCHESLCHIKNNVPHIYRKYYLKKFSRLVSSKSAELTSKILSCEGRDLLLQLQLYRQLCPTQERIFEVNSADFEDTNLENFFTEHLLYMCGTLFLMWQGDSWHMTHLTVNFVIFRFGIQGSGLKYNAHALWKNWTNVNNWVCSYTPINSVLIYDCIPEVGSVLELSKTIWKVSVMKPSLSFLNLLLLSSIISIFALIIHIYCMLVVWMQVLYSTLLYVMSVGIYCCCYPSIYCIMTQSP